MLPTVAVAVVALLQASHAAAQTNCIREGEPFMTGNKTLVNTCKRTVTVAYFDRLQCRQGCSLTLAGGKTGIVSTPGPREIEWIACWGRKKPRPGAGGNVTCK